MTPLGAVHAWVLGRVYGLDSAHVTFPCLHSAVTWICWRFLRDARPRLGPGLFVLAADIRGVTDLSGVIDSTSLSIPSRQLAARTRLEFTPSSETTGSPSRQRIRRARSVVSGRDCAPTILT